MTPKPVIPRRAAQHDLEVIDDYLFQRGGWPAKEQFLKAFREATMQIGLYPQTGSPRHGIILGIQGLRSWRITKFPYLLCYVEREEFIDLWRVLDGRRHLEVLLRDHDMD